MGHSNGLITPPVNTADVSYVTRKGSNDVGTLCGASNTMINKWAKYKPVIYPNLIDSTVLNGIVQINNDKTWKSTSTWWKANNGKCGFIVNRRTTGTALTDNWDNEWVYAPPTGGLAAPYRLIDFNYYLHSARSFVSVYAADEYYTNQAEGLLVQFQFYSGNDYQLKVTDFINKSNAGIFPYTADQKFYCGVLVAYGQSAYSTCNKVWATNPNAIGESMTTSSEGSGEWQRNVIVPKAQMPSTSTPYVTIYPYISVNGTYHSSSVSTTDARWDGGVVACPVAPISIIAVTSSISGVISNATCTYSVGSLSLTFTYTITAHGNFQADYISPTVYVLDADRDTTGQYSYESLVQNYHIISYEDGYGRVSEGGYPLNLGDGGTTTFNQNTVISRTGTAALVIGCDAISYVNQYKTKHGTTKAYMRIGIEMGKQDGDGYYVQTIFDNNGQGLEISGNY